MKSVRLFFSLFSILPLATCLFSQETVPYLLGASKDFELVGVPLQRPALAVVKILVVEREGIASWESSSSLQPFSVSMLKGRECYAEITGPSSHPFQGHRLEIHEAACLSEPHRKIFFQASPLNTVSFAQALRADTELTIREHIDINFLFGETIRNQILLGNQKPEGYRFFLNRGVNSEILNLVTLLTPHRTLLWLDSKAKIRKREDLVIVPGSALGVKFGSFRGPALGLTGDRRNTALPIPLQKGWNLLSYPFPEDLRLGLDWGGVESGIQGGSSPLGVDLLQIHQASAVATYALEIPIGAHQGKWRLTRSGRPGEWRIPASYLDSVPVGQGFLLWKNRDDPNHRFDPPKP